MAAGNDNQPAAMDANLRWQNGPLAAHTGSHL